MALRKRGKHFYGDSQADIRPELQRYSKANVYVVHRFADVVCACGETALRLHVDDNEGAAVRTCPTCNREEPIGDSARYLEGAELDECECPCGNDALELTLGASLYADSDDVRWLYIGCRCPTCKLVAVYADWKYDGIDYRELFGSSIKGEEATPAAPSGTPGIIKGIKFEKPAARSGKAARYQFHYVSAAPQVVTITCSEGFSVSPASLEVGPAAIEGWTFPSLVVRRRNATTASCLLTFRMGSFECRKRLKITE